MSSGPRCQVEFQIYILTVITLFDWVSQTGVKDGSYYSHFSSSWLWTVTWGLRRATEEKRGIWYTLTSTIVNSKEWNETRQLSLLQVFGRYFGLDPAQNTIVVYSVLRKLSTETVWLGNSCIVYDRKTNNCARLWTFQHKSQHLCLLLWCLPGFVTPLKSLPQRR